MKEPHPGVTEDGGSLVYPEYPPPRRSAPAAVTGHGEKGFAMHDRHAAVRPLTTYPRWCSAARRARLRAAACIATLVLAATLGACGGPSNLPPTAPTDVTATPIAAGVRVTWVDTSANETEFVVYRSGPGDVARAELARVPSDTASYQDFAVDEDGEYVYAVAAVNQAGTSDIVVQEPPDPVAPGVGVQLTVTFDGSGSVHVDDGFETVTCVSECVLGVAVGSTVVLTAEGAGESVFAGWAGVCTGAGACTRTVTTDFGVEARFARHVLVLVATGDSPVTVAGPISPADRYGTSQCTLAGGASCALAYDIASSFQVSINSTVVEPQATFVGYAGACTAPQGPQGRFCVVDVDGSTEVEVEVVRAPVTSDAAYQSLEDAKLVVDGGDGVLADVEDSAGDTHTAVLVSGPSDGSLSLFADGSFEFTPTTDANGPVTFQFLARDAHGNESDPSTATIAVLAVNDAPSFVLAGDPPATYGDGVAVSRPGFATDLDSGGGPDENAQTLSFTVVQTAGPAGLFSAPPTLSVSGTTATLAYTPAAGTYGTAAFDAVLKDSGGTANGGVDTSAAQSFTITVSPRVLTTVVAAGEGTIHRDPVGSAGSAPGTYLYGHGASVQLTATPSAGYQFASWSGGGCALQGTNPCTVAMTANRTVSATFSALVTVSGAAFANVTSSPSGINCNPAFSAPTCSAPFAVGTSLTLTANSPVTFTNVACDGAPTMPTTSCTFTVTAPVDVTVD